MDDNIISALKRLDLKKENERFVEFLNSDYCSEIMCKNKLIIHIEMGNIYNTGQNISGKLHLLPEIALYEISSISFLQGSSKLYFSRTFS